VWEALSTSYNLARTKRVKGRRKRRIEVKTSRIAPGDSRFSFLHIFIPIVGFYQKVMRTFDTFLPSSMAKGTQFSLCLREGGGSIKLRSERRKLKGRCSGQSSPSLKLCASWEYGVNL
jgi:hypothetical protein